MFKLKNILMFFISDAVREFSNAILSKPQDWVIGEYAIFHKEDPQLRLWIGNGMLFYEIAYIIKLSLIEKFYMKTILNKFIATRIRYNCNKNES